MRLGARESDFEPARARMVAHDLRGRGIRDPMVLDAFAQVPRHVFLPESDAREAYGDFPVPIGHGQTVSQPYIVALMVEFAGISPGDRVLEVGTGCGYQTAILSRLAGEVVTVEIIPELVERARSTLAGLGCANVEFLEGDGRLGVERRAPFDAIVVSAAPSTVPHALGQQLKEGGRLVIPVGPEGGTQRLMRLVRHGARIDSEEITFVRFVPLV